MKIGSAKIERASCSSRLWLGCCAALFGSLFIGFVSLKKATAAPHETPFNEAFLKNEDYQQYLKFFEEVYRTVAENYYHPVSSEQLRKFFYIFNTKLYPQFKLAGSSRQFIKWRSAAHLVDALKSSDDIFSAFYPPKEAKEYEQTALGKRIDLGIEGAMTKEGFHVSRVEIRTDAYEKGLREGDLLLAIDNVSVMGMTEEAVLELLTPLEGVKVTLLYRDDDDRKKYTIIVESKEYFKEFVFKVPVDVPEIYGIRIERFNRTTGEDLERYIRDALEKHAEGLIIDLRGNPGGPPLAAREISAFFLTPGEEFAYFQKRDRPKSSLDVPDIPDALRFTGPMVILVDEKSGSAAELFSGILQRRRRAVLVGKNTAGQVFLKSMFNFDDGSMVLLVTARGHHPDGTVFSFSGIDPDERIEDDGTDLIRYAAEYLKSKI